MYGFWVIHCCFSIIYLILLINLTYNRISFVGYSAWTFLFIYFSIKFIDMAKLLMLLFLAATLKSSFGAICPNPQAYSGQSLCDPWGTYCGECVSFYKVFHLFSTFIPMTADSLLQFFWIQVCSDDTRTTSSWVQGQKVRGASLAFGTGIATFTNGKYDSGHTAIYVGQSSTGIDVWDQWVGQPVHQRTLRFDSTSYQNDGDNFYVIQ
jgi:hypothetical protein